MYYRVPDFDLRPRRVATPMPMLSTLQVDDDGDSLDALAASAVVPEQSDARHIALGALPPSLSSPSPQTTWAVMRPPVRTMPYERWMLGSVLSVGFALFGLFAAMAWRVEHPRVRYVEDVAQPLRATPELPIDAISSASP